VSAAERAAWLAYAPLLALLPIDRWSLADRRALARLIRAKAEVSEIDYARRFNEHTTLQRALAAY
jgi:hypothetical protein